MVKAIKGFNDVLPEQSGKWQHVENVLIDVLNRFGYQQLRIPIVEQTELFARAIGGATDIVEKEMYSFFDKSEPPTSLTLRPEGTAGAVRAVIEHNLLRGDNPKLWYIGPMFRYERPQKGRYRQFHQLGVEAFGNELPDAEAELISMTVAMWQALGISEQVTLQINSLGEQNERVEFKKALVDYFSMHKQLLDADSQRRLTTNPLRILDSKDAQTQSLVANAPKLTEFLGEQSLEHFETLKNHLNKLDIAFEVNPNLVRGLDYYNKTVFEWVTDKLGAQATVCAGGRYDELIGILKSIQNNKNPDKRATSQPAVGFGLGLERLLLLIAETATLPQIASCDVFVVAQPDLYDQGMLYAQKLRQKRPDLKVKMASATSLKSQMKKADKSGAKAAVIIAQQEMDHRQISIKMMDTGQQQAFDYDHIFNQGNELGI